MTIRNDITMFWESSPRIIQIDAPSTEIMIQDLIDTCSYLCALPANIDDGVLLESSGKEYLTADGSVKVGLTVTLNNAKISFEARPSPDWVLCEITGGNVVAVEDIKADPRVYIDPRHPTAYTSVDRTSSSSATLQELEDIQHSSFGGGVTIDIVNGSPGTDYPTGTHQQPSNNFTDAKIIADERGFDVFYIIGDFNSNITDNIGGYTLKGQAPTKSTITIVSGTNTNKTEFYDCSLTGTVSGGIYIKDCHVYMLSGVGDTVNHTDIMNSVLCGNVVLKNTSTTGVHFVDCLSGATGPNVPVLDVNGSVSEILFGNFSGGIKIKNVSQGQNMSFAFVSGQIIFDSTVSNVNAIVRGSVKITDNSTGGNIDATSVLLPQTAFVDGFVSIDPLHGESGTTFPIGTPTRPVDNISDALIIANMQKIRKFYIRDAVTLLQPFTDWTFIGIGSIFNDVINLNNQTLNGCRFESLTISGTMVATNNVYFRCNVKDVIGLDGLFIDSVLQGTLIMGGVGSSVIGQNIAAYGNTPGSPAIVNIGGSGRIFQASLDGAIYFTTASTGSAIEIGLKTGTVILDPTCTGGTALFTGVGSLMNLSTMSIINNLLDEPSITNSVWSDATASDLLNDVNFIKSIESGRWKVDTNTNQMYFYAEDNVTLIATFNLFDEFGNPAFENIFERKVV